MTCFVGTYIGRFERSFEPSQAAEARAGFSKVPEVTVGFWIIKVAATTLGETGGDAVTMSLGLGYLVGTLIFAAIFAALVAAQIRAKRFQPFMFWAVIVATTTVGTTSRSRAPWASTPTARSASATWAAR